MILVTKWGALFNVVYSNNNNFTVSDVQILNHNIIHTSILYKDYLRKRQIHAILFS